MDRTVKGPGMARSRSLDSNRLPAFLRTENAHGLDRKPLILRQRERDTQRDTTETIFFERTRSPSNGPPRDQEVLLQESRLDGFDAAYSSINTKNTTIHLEADVLVDIDDELEWLNRLMRIGHFQEAKAFFESHLKEHINQPSVCVQYAEILMRMKDYGEVRRLHDKMGHVFGKLEPDWQPVLANWRLIQAVAMSYTQFEISQIRSKIGPGLDMILPLAEGERETSTGIRVLCLAMELYRRTGIEVSARLGAGATDGTHLRSWFDWSELYAPLLSQGRIWDFHDLFLTAVATYSIHETLKGLVSGSRDADVLEFIVVEWSGGPEKDESTLLALLDLLSVSALHTKMHPADFELVARCLELAEPIGEQLMENFPSHVRSRPFLHWVLAKTAYSARAESKAPFTHDHMLDFPGARFYPLSLSSSCISIPYYIPVIRENPGLVALEAATSRHSEALAMVLRASEELQDYHLQQLCVKELILRSENQDTSSRLFSRLADLQKATLNMDGYFSTCLSRYLILKDARDEERRQLSVDLAALGWWETPNDLVSPARAAARDIIQVAILEDSGINSIPKSIAAGQRYYPCLPPVMQDLIDRHRSHRKTWTRQNAPFSRCPSPYRAPSARTAAQKLPPREPKSATPDIQVEQTPGAGRSSGAQQSPPRSSDLHRSVSAPEASAQVGTAADGNKSGGLIIREFITRRQPAYATTDRSSSEKSDDEQAQARNNEKKESPENEDDADAAKNGGLLVEEIRV